MVLSLLIGISLSNSIAQSNKKFSFVFEGEQAPDWSKKFSGTYDLSTYKDWVDKLRLTAYSDGYISMSTRFTGVDSSVCSIALGEQYYWVNLRPSKESSELIDRFVGRRHLEGGKVSPERIEVLSERVLRQLENRGYPFASVSLDSVEIEGSNVSALLVVSKGPLIRLDSIRLNGNLEIRKNYISNFLNLKEAQAYDESRIVQSKGKLDNLSFANQVKEPRVTFIENSAFLDVYLNKRRANRFDGIIGFLPDENGDLLITGDVRLHLENTLKQGENFDLTWRKLQTNTQDFHAELITPFILNSPISVDGKLQIYRRDTLFSNVDRQLGLRYMFAGTDYLRLFFSRTSSSLLSTSAYEGGLVIPPFLDKRMSSYGIGLKLLRVDYVLNPSKGIAIQLESSVGTKEIGINNRLPESLYDSLELKTLQWSSTADFSYYLSPVKRLVWHQNVQAAYIMNDQLFNNEAFRLGGFRSIRGFDEESIFATSFSIVRSELRYQLERDGFVYAFFDGAWYENTSVNRIGNRRDTPYSFGVGTSFGTTAGIFNLSYGIGSQSGNPLLIRTAKIHFGYTSVF